MRNIRIVLVCLIIGQWTQYLSAQFSSSYHEQQLIHGQKLQKDYSYYELNNDKPKRLTYILPSVGVTLMSPQLTYGDMYVSSTKTLDLVAATESQKDFDLQLNARVSYGGLAYNFEQFRFSFFHEMLADARMEVPNHLFKLATEGNIHLINSDVDINPVALFQSTHKWALGADYQLDKLLVGLQFNVYTGNAYLNTHDSNLNIDFEENFFEMAFDKNINVESSGAIIYNKIDSVDFILGDNALTAAGSFNNLGFGLSAQFSFEASESLKFFGRIEDLGFIKWTDKTQVLEEKSYDAFGGFDVREAYLRGESYSVKDTFFAMLEIDNSTSSFNSTLLYSSFLGVDYDLNEFVSLGAIVRSRNNGSKQMFFIEPSATWSPLRNTHITLANIFHKDALFNPKLVMQTEISNTFGINMSLVNPQSFGKYYDTKMIHASLGMYLKFIKI